MGFLIAELTIMLLAAAAAGAALTYWWVRHQFRDATAEYLVLQAKLAASEEALQTVREQLQAEPTQAQDAVDISGMGDRLSELRDAQNARIRAVEGQLRTLSRQIQEALPHPMDAEDLARRLDTLRAAMPQPRLGGVESRLNRLESMIGAVCERVGAELPPPSLYSSPPEAGSLAPATSVAPAAAASQPPAPAASSSSPSAGPGARSSDAPKPPISARQPGSNLLHKPTFGTPDNLKRISGVGPKLEGLLHRLGVYYYWQVAEWTPADVTYVDARLESFKGRIRRDGWTAQAKRLAAEPNANQGPNVATSRASSIRSLEGDQRQSTG